MFIFSNQGASAPTIPPASSPFPPPSSDTETVRHLLFVSLTAVQPIIRVLHKRGYAEPNDWRNPISTGRPDEVMAILTKRVRYEGLNIRGGYGVRDSKIMTWS